MKEDKKNKLVLGILIGALVSLIISFSVFIIYDKISSDDNVNLETEESNENNQNELNYVIDDNKISINNKEVDITGTSIEIVGKINDVLIIKVWLFDFYDYYIIDKNANVVSVIIGAAGSSSNNIKKIILKGRYVDECVIEDNSLIIKSNNVRPEPTYNSCSKNDDDIVEYTEKLIYLGNNQFSESILLKSTTAKEYVENNNIKCQ